MRASDAERERVAEQLRDAAGEGRLTVDELGQRLDQAYAATTGAELERLTDDLPASRPAPPGRLPVRPGEDGQGLVVSIMGGADRRGRWRIGRRCRVINVMGGADLDLNDAELAASEVELNIISIMGGSVVRVPENLNVEVSELAIMGANSVKLGEGQPDPGGPTVRIRLFSLMGGTDVRRGRPRPRRRRHLHHP